MATRKYGLSLAEEHGSVTEAVGSSVTDHIEVTIDLAQIADRNDALLILDKIKDYILEDVWPPA